MLHHIRNLDIGRFNRICSILGLAFLLVTIGAKWAWYEHRHLPQAQDYTQYYMGGLMALRGNWDSIYPIPLPGGLHNVGFDDSSTLPEKYSQATTELGTEGSYRFMQPPPAALLFAPLAMLPYKTSQLVWTILLIFAAWGIAPPGG